jgi:hypothetical protein
MAPRTASDMLQVSMLGRWTNGHPVVNVLHYRIDAGVGEVDVSGEAADVVQNWQSQLVPEFRDNYRFEGGAYIDLRSEDGETGVIPPFTNEPTQGGSTGQAANPGDALLIHKRTTSRRGTRSGRMYLPPPGGSAMDEDGRIDTLTQNAINTRLASFLENTTQGDSPLDPPGTERNRYLVVLHKDGSYSRVTSLQCDGLIASQRRRVR